ncbi:hypothetical protein RND81_05G111500 [Saponaria officinalis]|uniref:J domain-containing protein n=1 Tax=Saponaria officinalis TaxID=3572 RepID=A0AAW1KVW5_SAPOF
MCQCKTVLKMARKGNQPKRGSDQTSSKSSKKDPELKVIADDLLDGEQHSPSLMSGINNTSFAGDGRKKSRKSRNVATKDELMDDTGNGPSVRDSSVSFEDVKNIGRVDSNVSHVRNQRPKRVNGTFGHTPNGSYTAKMPDKVNIFCHLALERLKKSAMPILRTSNEWLEKHQPFFTSVGNKIHEARDYVRWKVAQTYPIVLKWLFHAGNILLLVSMVWLDCALRGMASFLRMGTTSFLAVLWFSILSVVAMIGTFKFLLILAVSAVIGILLGFMVSLLIIAVSGAAVLWLYGSFWTTSFVIILAGLAFISSHERLALLITTIYSVYCVWAYVGWLGLLVALNLLFISSDALIYFLKHNIDDQRSNSYGRTDGFNEQSSFTGEAHFHHSDFGSGESMDRNAGDPSTSGTDSEITSEDEVIRLLNCTDHYSALGLSRYQQVDVSVLKREYRKKAMLVHPDKNMGNEKAAEAFQKLQNAYEVLLDSLKRKAYDDDLRREELVNYFCRFQSASRKNGRNGLFPNGFAHSEGDGDDPLGESRRIACKKCGSFHMWFHTKKSKLKARWCQDCKDFHQAKDGDGWVEQSSQPLFFGILQKVDLPVAYVCADSKVYDATEWYICQGMRCPANSHKPSFHVNTNVTKNSHGKGSKMEENMTEEEFFEWLHTAMQSGTFENFAGNETPQTSAKASSKSGSGPNTSGGGGSSSSNSKRKKKGKKQW